MQTLLNVKRLSVAFKSPRALLRAVDDVDFELRAGEAIALIGESGCGKTLTSLALMRLLPPTAFYGLKSRVELPEGDVLDVPERLIHTFRGKRLGMIFQEPMTALNPVMRIDEQLAEAIRQTQSPSKKSMQETLLRLLSEVELTQPEVRLRQYPHQLSGGQRQRVVIAMALAANPDILIADEPTTALDATVQAQILKLLKKLQHQRHMSLIFITHDFGVVKAIADRIYVMYAGQFVEVADKETFFKQPLHPYNQQLMEAIPSLHKRNHPLQGIKGAVPNLGAMPKGCRFHPRCVHAFSPCSKVKPQLQKIHDRYVRCHLYPKHHSPPPLPQIHPETAHAHIGMHLATSSTPKEPIMRAEKVVVNFRAPKGAVIKAVDEISCQLYQGKTLALVGESGSGKTTLGRSLIGLQPISSGHVYYRDISVQQLRGRSRREFHKNVQIIFQDPFASMNPKMIVENIIAEGMLVLGMSKRTIRKRLLDLLDYVALPTSSLNRYPHQFSGGQRQRICIARALATSPQVLICDEPTSALDVAVQAQILNLLRTLQHELNLAYLFITHNMSVVSYMADDVIVMQHGRVVEKGTLHQVFTSPQQKYTKLLLKSSL